MKIKIELSEEDAACIWQNGRQQSLTETINDVLSENAAEWRVKNAIEDFRASGQPVAIKCAECNRYLQFDIRTGFNRCVNDECEKWGQPVVNVLKGDK